MTQITPFTEVHVLKVLALYSLQILLNTEHVIMRIPELIL